MIDGNNVKEITQVINGKNVTFNEYSTALTHSAFIGDIDTCKWLIEHGTDVNAKEKGDDATVLFFVAKSGKISLCRWLIDEKGLDVNAKLKDGVPPLGIAAEKNHFNLFKWLVEEKGADVNVEDIHGVTLSEYVEKTEGLERMAKFLKSRGAC